MAINKGIKVILVFLLSFCLTIPNFNFVSTSKEKQPTVKIADPEFPDKVYAFLSPSDVLMFNDIYFEQFYTYYIWVEIVTPNNCSLNITLWDPDGMQFYIFESDLFLEPDGGNYYEIPYGCALGGNYTIEFVTISTNSLNLYIRIEKGIKCLFDKIQGEELENMIFYRVTRFYNGMTLSHTIDLKPDFLYKFYFGGVSPILYVETNIISLNFSLFDPGDIEYIIYTNETLVPITDVNRIKFGTAIGGEYKLDLEIKSDVEYMNIGYLVIELHKISHVIDPNQSNPTNSTSSPTSTFQMPTEWTAGIIAFFGVIITSAIIIVVKNRSKNIVKFKDHIKNND
ncbi:MAG: hypothetical protein ACFFA0_05160 [Promethearchaeota archaeon]